MQLEWLQQSCVSGLLPAATGSPDPFYPSEAGLSGIRGQMQKEPPPLSCPPAPTPMACPVSH